MDPKVLQRVAQLLPRDPAIPIPVEHLEHPPQLSWIHIHSVAIKWRSPQDDMGSSSPLSTAAGNLLMKGTIFSAACLPVEKKRRTILSSSFPFVSLFQIQLEK
ncbi:hypothetical protein SAY87_003334 [Trapa incisa]|uniref:Uncharacterized protein n=1 Tax=Trapa incisa TaxID=236973 RepID=A0AAN7KFL2_9MYRT|nr:hypothetical protein SAY87_003334 [Trapa incisa]